MGELTFKEVPNKKVDELHINRTKGAVNAGLRSYSYVDKDTNHFICYIPSLELSGYGLSEKEAREMLHFSLKDYFHFLLTLSEPKMKQELSGLGWNHNRFKNKDYSKAYVDKKGELKNLAVNEAVEEEMLAI